MKIFISLFNMSLEQNIGYVAKSISVLFAASFLLSFVYD
jgi:uncharacterized membrane protein YkgB